MNLNKTIFTIMAAALCAVVHAAPIEWGSSDASITRQGDFLNVNFLLELTNTDVPSDRALLITPYLVNEDDTIALKSVGIYGRNRYLYYQRRSDNMISGSDEIVIKNAEKPTNLKYDLMVPYSDRSGDTRLVINSTLYGCCAKPINSSDLSTDAFYRDFRPWQITPLYVAPTAISEKTDSLADKAFINFIVNRTEIKPDYRDNFAELGKIRNSIESIMDDPDCTITGIWLKGYASPEGKYDHNSKLAQGRTLALKEYIRNLYSFQPSLVRADYQPEDWDGLKSFIAGSNIDNRDEILLIIDMDVDPDDKEALIKKKYPTQYSFLLEQVYPSLRHTDYRIDYTIRRFTDVEEIRRVFETQPRKLDLNELYILASQFEPGSEDFDNVFATAVKMYPEDETANLNAANAALQKGNLKDASDFLAKAGGSDEANYARGILALLQGNYGQAAEILKSAAAAGIESASDLLRQMEYNRIIK